MAALRHPRATKPLLAAALLVTLAMMGMTTRSAGQDIKGPEPRAADPIDWRWSFTQGGLTVVVLVLAWSYRKDLERWSTERIKLESIIVEQKHSFEKVVFEEKIAYQQSRIDDAIRSNRSLESLTVRTNDTLKATADALAAHTTALALNTKSNDGLASSVDKLDDRLERIEHNGP